MVVTSSELSACTHNNPFAAAENGTLIRNWLDGEDVATGSANWVSESKQDGFTSKADAVDDSTDMWLVVEEPELHPVLDDFNVDTEAATTGGLHAGAKDIRRFVSGPSETTIPAFSARAA